MDEAPCSPDRPGKAESNCVAGLSFEQAAELLDISPTATALELRVYCKQNLLGGLTPHIFFTFPVES